MNTRWCSWVWFEMLNVCLTPRLLQFHPGMVQETLVIALPWGRNSSMIMRAWFTLQIEGWEDTKNKMKDLGSSNIAFSSLFGHLVGVEGRMPWSVVGVKLLGWRLGRGLPLGGTVSARPRSGRFLVWTQAPDGRGQPSHHSYGWRKGPHWSSIGRATPLP
jgi:hypothetical protein